MPLFADEVSTSWVITVVGMLLSSLGAFGSTLFTWLTARDKLRFDAKMLTLEESVQECQKDRDLLRSRLDEIEKQLLSKAFSVTVSTPTPAPPPPAPEKPK